MIFDVRLLLFCCQTASEPRSPKGAVDDRALADLVSDVFYPYMQHFVPISGAWVRTAVVFLDCATQKSPVSQTARGGLRFWILGVCSAALTANFFFFWVFSFYVFFGLLQTNCKG